MTTVKNYSPIKAERFVSVIDLENGNFTSYSTQLDGSSAPSAYEQAILTAKAYNGEVFSDVGDGKLLPVKSFKKKSNN